MVYTTHKNGDDWGMAYYCSNHIIYFRWFSTVSVWWFDPSHLSSGPRSYPSISSAKTRYIPSFFDLIYLDIHINIYNHIEP